MTTFLIIISTAFVVFVMLYLFAPLKYEILRMVTIEKPLPEVFEFISQLKNQDIWTPWISNDENLVIKYIGTDGEVGFISTWSGSKILGEGELEIMKIETNRVIETQIRFKKPFKVSSDTYMRVYEAGNKTEVLWGFRGIYKRPMNIVMFFIGLENKIGRNFEIGLSRLKHYIEA